MRLKNTLAYVVAVLILAIIAYLAVAFYSLNFKALLPSGAPSTVVRLAPKETTNDLLQRLGEQFQIKHTKVLRFYLRLTGVGKKMQVGEYSITSQTSTLTLLDKISKGDVVLHDITFVEGSRFSDILTKVRANKNLEHEYTTEEALLTYLGSDKKSVEGLLYSDTYRFHWPMSDLSLFKRSYNRMQKVLQEKWQSRSKDLPYKTPYDALIMASIIEKETAVPEERNEVAGVLIDRLRKKMRLQVDPTVSYGLNEPADYKLTKADLRKYTPYNTYRIYGLPPTPIDMPSKSSIIAALHPEFTGALYYVSKGDGSHVFSKTYEEHKAAIARYILREKSSE